MSKILTVEAKLFLREPAALLFALLLPLVLLLGLGSLPRFQEAVPELGGQRIIDTHFPSMMMLLGLITLAFTVMPATLATYRESGVLRRMSTTPVRAGRLLTAQLLINVVVAVLASTILTVLGWAVLDIGLPREPLGFAVSFVLGGASLFALGLLIASISPTAKAAPGIGTVLMFPLMFISGMWVPRESMPEVLRQIGDFLPVAPFGQALRDTWAGHAPNPRDLVVMAATVLIAGGAAARLFRWE
ncbi:ABC-2 type transport system permease protein [Thermocatellispora tengchongensis]|uniref:Transport permease protein n=1 Tax=Thermocatellispora tengchongensis TaxID=1073253 RepID=A0A840NZL0_9ACTN|nr:ABC transporter permease [Thermocatellispora tengchongensis]MBB5130437.1 ABC-2 type transport system permease protein [Thermocatellispora tengchongensis]